RGTRAENSLQLVGRRDLQLIVTTVLRAFVGAPANKLCGVPKAGSLQVIVRHLADALGPHRLPAQVLAAIPAARRTGQAQPLGVCLRLSLSPAAPGVAVERALAERRELDDELF